jgi:hypothetical protein
MDLTEQQAQAERTLAGAYPAGVGFDVRDAPDTGAMDATIRVYDELVALGRADLLTEDDDPQFAGKRVYRLSDAAAEAIRTRGPPPFRWTLLG